jgi:tetraacyldisaccharide 4'-kinase
MMRAPGFWDRGGALPVLLAPLSAAWTAVTRARLRRGPAAKAGRPVICVGNLTAGGTGKTPAVVAILERLAARSVRAAVVSRGYGGSLPGSMRGPVRVDPAQHRAAEVGDEPLMLAAWAPVWVGRDRAAAARAAVADGAEVVVMDDGLQNPSLHKDVALVVVDLARGFGNGRVMPAGPLREPVADGMARADLLLGIGDGPLPEGTGAETGAVPVLRGRIEPLATGMPWAGLRVLAFAGIGRPEKFFATLRGLGVDLVRTRSFPDHAAYGELLLQRLEAEAKSLGVQLVTTEKDAVRLPEAVRRRVLVLPVRLAVDDWTPFDRALDALLAGRG